MDEFSDPVLTQIGICLDKKFQVIGCELTHGGIYGKCPKSGAVEYPATEKLKYQTVPAPILPPYKAGHAGMYYNSGMNIVFEVEDLGHGLVFQNLAFYS